MLTQKTSGYDVALVWMKLPLASITSSPMMLSRSRPHPRLLYPIIGHSKLGPTAGDSAQTHSSLHDLHAHQRQPPDTHHAVVHACLDRTVLVPYFRVGLRCRLVRPRFDRRRCCWTLEDRRPCCHLDHQDWRMRCSRYAQPKSQHRRKGTSSCDAKDHQSSELELMRHILGMSATSSLHFCLGARSAEDSAGHLLCCCWWNDDCWSVMKPKVVGLRELREVRGRREGYWNMRFC